MTALGAIFCLQRGSPSSVSHRYLWQNGLNGIQGPSAKQVTGERTLYVYLSKRCCLLCSTPENPPRGRNLPTSTTPTLKTPTGDWGTRVGVHKASPGPRGKCKKDSRAVSVSRQGLPCPGAEASVGRAVVGKPASHTWLAHFQSCPLLTWVEEAAPGPHSSSCQSRSPPSRPGSPGCDAPVVLHGHGGRLSSAGRHKSDRATLATSLLDRRVNLLQPARVWPGEDLPRPLLTLTSLDALFRP